MKGKCNFLDSGKFLIYVIRYTMKIHANFRLKKSLFKYLQVFSNIFNAKQFLKIVIKILYDMYTQNFFFKLQSTSLIETG